MRGIYSAESDRDTDAYVADEMESRPIPAPRWVNPPGTAHVRGRVCARRPASGASVTAGWSWDVTCPECLADSVAMEAQRQFELGGR